MKYKFCSIMLIFVLMLCLFPIKQAKSMPFYGLKGEEITLISRYKTTFKNSSSERKHNIALCAKKLNNIIIEPFEEFSFNKVVGERTEKLGYKKAKIIFNNKFIDGVGGGVCQVSTTIYNALLLAGLKVIEHHAHSLQVSYIAPSFDAMVNSGSADLKFVNNSVCPILIKNTVNAEHIEFVIYGAKLKYKIKTESIIKEYIEDLEPEIVEDENNNYPNLLEGEEIVIAGKKGIKSEGYIIKYKENGEIIKKELLRKDKYNPIKSIIIKGKKQNNKVNE